MPVFHDKQSMGSLFFQKVIQFILYRETARFVTCEFCSVSSRITHIKKVRESAERSNMKIQVF